MTDASGRLVGLPLRHGAQHCRFHAKVLCETASSTECKDNVLFYIDLETDGLDVFRDNIVEIAALESASGAAFCALVRPPVQATQSPTAAAVHGINEAELQEAMPFKQVFKLWVQFLDAVANSALVSDDSSSSQEAEGVPTLPFPTPQIQLAGHNGRAFDFPMLLSNCVRKGCAVEHLGRYAYIDTLDVCKAMSGTSRSGGCMKLQCLLQGCCCYGSGALQAHRALDDCRALQGVMCHVACSVGIRERELLSRFAFEINVAQSCANILLYS